MPKDGKKVRIAEDVLKELHMLKAENSYSSVSDLIEFILSKTNLYQEDKLDDKFDVYSIFSQGILSSGELSREEKLSKIHKHLDAHDDWIRAMCQEIRVQQDSGMIVDKDWENFLIKNQRYWQ